jgi:hypothetical protein
LPEVGTLSADGSRRWDGRFWVPLRTDHPVDELPPLVVRPVPTELTWERRGFRLGGVVLATIVGLVLSYSPIPMPPPGSLDAAMTEIAIAFFIRSWFMFAAVVVILSIGRQGIDVLLLRAMVVAFILGAAFIGFLLSPALFFPIPVNPRFPLPLTFLAGGLAWAVILGPVMAIFAALANLLWYRSLRSLRPQLRIFNRGK